MSIVDLRGPENMGTINAHLRILCEHLKGLEAEISKFCVVAGFSRKMRGWTVVGPL